MIPKFRAWDKKVKEMLEVENIDFVNETLFLRRETEFSTSWVELNLNNVALMQSTGLHDINGKEIFEGDILYHPLQGMRKVYYPFLDTVASYGLENIKNGMRNTLEDAHRLYEIIGNIHEHSHLLDDGGIEND